MFDFLCRTHMSISIGFFPPGEVGYENRALTAFRVEIKLLPGWEKTGFARWKSTRVGLQSFKKGRKLPSRFPNEPLDN
jgi:hypothetical protein